jgi:hypothetical protein
MAAPKGLKALPLPGNLNYAEQIAIGVFQDNEVSARSVTPRIASRTDTG